MSVRNKKRKGIISYPYFVLVGCFIDIKVRFTRSTCVRKMSNYFSAISVCGEKPCGNKVHFSARAEIPCGNNPKKKKKKCTSRPSLHEQRYHGEAVQKKCTFQLPHFCPTLYTLIFSRHLIIQTSIIWTLDILFQNFTRMSKQLTKHLVLLYLHKAEPALTFVCQLLLLVLVSNGYSHRRRNGGRDHGPQLPTIMVTLIY